MAQRYSYYHKVFGPGPSKKQTTLSFLEFGIPLAPAIGSPLCYQCEEALKDPEWVNEFFEADVAEMRELHGEEMIVEEYRGRLVRSFAKAPSTPESKRAWAAFKTKYAQRLKTVARTKTAVSKRNKETGKKGVQKPAQKPVQQARGGARGGQHGGRILEAKEPARCLLQRLAC